MTINEGIAVLKAARDMFGGDVECTFLAPDNPGNKAKLELKDVDSSAVSARHFPEDGYDPNRLSSLN